MNRRGRNLTRAQLFAGAMMLYPTWYDPYRDDFCEIEHVLDTLEARARAWREDHQGYVAARMRLWKRRPLAEFFKADVAWSSMTKPNAQQMGPTRWTAR